MQLSSPYEALQGRGGISSQKIGVDVIQRLLIILMFACTQLSAMGDANDEERYYHELAISDSDKRAIHKLITTMAEKNVVQLGFKKKSLEKLGDQIYHVHPLRFFGYIFSQPDLVYGMYEIKKSYFKWDNFVDGMSKKMREESRNNNLLKYVPGFAKALDVDANHVSSYLRNHDCEGFIRYML